MRFNSPTDFYNFQWNFIYPKVPSETEVINNRKMKIEIKRISDDRFSLDLIPMAYVNGIWVYNFGMSTLHSEYQFQPWYIYLQNLYYGEDYAYNDLIKFLNMTLDNIKTNITKFLNQYAGVSTTPAPQPIIPTPTTAVTPTYPTPTYTQEQLQAFEKYKQLQAILKDLIGVLDPYTDLFPPALKNEYNALKSIVVITPTPDKAQSQFISVKQQAISFLKKLIDYIGGQS